MIRLITRITARIVAWVLILFLPAISHAQDVITLPVSKFNPDQIADKKVTNPMWALLEVGSDRLTDYSLTADSAGNQVIKAESRDAASGLIYKINVDPNEYPIIEWGWKIDKVLPKGNLMEKDGDDYPARIYITFDYDRSDLSFGDKLKHTALKTFTSYNIPLRALNYIWANKVNKGTIADNPHIDWSQMIAIESGNQKAGQWITESRNILEDYRKAFGEDPPNITGIAIMTDSDNTGGSTRAYYRDIVLKRKLNPAEDKYTEVDN